MSLVPCGCAGQLRCHYHGGTVPTLPVHVHVFMDNIERVFCGEHTTPERLARLSSPRARVCISEYCQRCWCSFYPSRATACQYVPTPWFEQVLAALPEGALLTF